MTIINLIEKLEEEAKEQAYAGKEANGAHGVLEAWYTEILTLNLIRDHNRFDSDYYKIEGLIWGLKAAYYITKDEKDQLLEELTQISNRFYGINDQTP